MAHNRLALLGALLIGPSVLAARVQDAAGPDADPRSAVGEPNEDPRARFRVMRAWRGDDGPEARWRVLEEAGRERDRSGAFSSKTTLSAVGGSVFVNIGPTRADYEVASVKYLEIDSGRARSIVVDPINPNIVYIATSGGGVWKSYDKGGGWEPITDQLGTLSMGALAMDPASPQILYLGFGDPFDILQPGIVKSGDGGATWSAALKLTATYGANAFLAQSVRDIKVDPLNSQVVLVATDVGLFRSTNAGNSYQQVSLPDSAGNASAYYGTWSVAWVAANIWLASGVQGDLSGKSGCPSPGVSTPPGCTLGLWRSTDDGATWTWSGGALPGGNGEIAQAGRATLAAALSTSGDPATARVYLVAGDGVGGTQRDVYRSDDGGQTFISLRVNSSRTPTNPNIEQPDLNIMHEQAWYNQAILVDPTNPDNVFVGGNRVVARSLDGGGTWQVLTMGYYYNSTGRPYAHPDNHAFAMGSDGTFWAGNDGGLTPSSTATNPDLTQVKFTSARNEGLVTHLAYDLACAPDAWPSSMQAWVAGGLQDNGTRLRTAANTTFNQVFGGDGFGVAFSGDVNGGVPGAFLASVFGNTGGVVIKSTDGGTVWNPFVDGATGPFGYAGALVRYARDQGTSDPQTFLTFNAPAGNPAPQPSMYRSVAGGLWNDISGTLHWQNDAAAGITAGPTAGFTTPAGASIGLRQIGVHSKRANVYGVVSNKFAYVTVNGGTDWYVSTQPRPAGSKGGIYRLSSIDFDPSDTAGQIYYVVSRSMYFDDGSLVPQSFGHLYKTSNGGATWTSLGTQPLAQRGLPMAGAEVVRIDPNDGNTIYVGTEIGLYRSTDGGANFDRFGGASLPLVEVSDLCISAASKKLVIATYGRGFWEISTDSTLNPAAVKGRGDTNFDLKVDGQDLIDLADAWNSDQASPTYRYQADLVGAAIKVDDSDLSAMLLKFGGQP